MSRNHLAKDDDTVAVPKAARDARAVLEGVTPAAAAARTCTGPSRSTWAGAGPQLLASRHLAYPPLLQGRDTACHKATTHEARGGVASWISFELSDPDLGIKLARPSKRGVLVVHHDVAGRGKCLCPGP